MSSSNQSSFFIAAVSFTTLAPIAVAVGQSSVAVSPFVSYVPSAAQNPLVGMSLTFGGTTGLALRGSADISIKDPDKINSTAGSTTGGTGGVRPWGADADAILFLGGLGGGATVFSRSLSPYVFSGIGLTGGDSAGTNVVQHVWSYGAGAAIPLGFDADLFGEARWRMSEYVLPTAKDAPSSKSELRFGLSFHVGGGAREPTPVPTRRRGRRYGLESYDAYDYPYDDYDDVAADARRARLALPAPAVTPAVSTATVTAINVRLPHRVMTSRARVRSGRQVESITVTRRTATARRSRGIVTRSREGSIQTRSTRTKTTTSSSRRSTRRGIR